MTKLIFILSHIFVSAQSLERVENGNSVSVSHSVSRSVAMMRLSNGSLCSASFLTKTMLVTAAHCTSRKSPSDVTMYIVDSSGKTHSSPVKRVINHPDYFLQRTNNGTMVRNDIALVELAREFPLAVRPLAIGSVSDMKTQERTVTVVGYGINSQWGGGAGALRSGTMVGIVEPIYYFFNREGLYMEPATNQAACPGDSGGAVLKGSLSSNQLIGVNSLSSGCKGVFNPASYSEVVSHHRSWIRRYIPGI